MYSFGKASNLPIRKDFIERYRVGSGTGKEPEAQVGKVEKKNKGWWMQKNRKEREHTGRRSQL